MELKSLTMPFGKYRGETLASIADRDILYVDSLNNDMYIWHRGIKAEVRAICEERAAAIDIAREVKNSDG